jgi:hypothetical protein
MFVHLRTLCITPVIAASCNPADAVTAGGHRMRISAALVLATTLALAPVLAVADPAQPQSSLSVAPAMQAPAVSISAVPPPRLPAAETVVVTGQAENDDDGDLNRIVCHAEPARTGSRIGGDRECFTERQWNNRKKQSQAILEGAQTRSLSSGYGR